MPTLFTKINKPVYTSYVYIYLYIYKQTKFKYFTDVCIDK